MIVTGGIGTFTDVVAYDYDLNSKLLPSLNTGRQAHSCGHYVDSNGYQVLIVAAGNSQSSGFLDSTEMLNYGAEASQWDVLPNAYPVKVFFPISVSIGNTIISAGQYNFINE